MKKKALYVGLDVPKITTDVAIATSIYVPTFEDEAIRDLVRCRDDIKRFERKARQRLLSFLLGHGYQYSGKKNWTKSFYNWLATVKFSHSARKVTLQEYIEAINECSERIKRITEQIQVHVQECGVGLGLSKSTRPCEMYRLLCPLL